MSCVQVKSIRELKKLAKENNGIEVFIQLNHGLCSTKFVQVEKRKGLWFWTIENYIDNTTSYSLEETNIPKAIKRGALWRTV